MLCNCLSEYLFSLFSWQINTRTDHNRKSVSLFMTSLHNTDKCLNNILYPNNIIFKYCIVVKYYTK